MTDQEMYAEVCKECKGKSCDETCRLREFCDSVHGYFRDSHDNLVKAMEILHSGSTVDHPDHYNQGDIECIDAMIAAYGEEAVASFCLINAFKYVWRAEHKNGKEDVEKAIWYLQKRLELTDNE